MNLHEIAIEHGTDKAEHGYCPIYEELFGHLREEPVKLLELGVYHGASLRMWNDYFTNSDVDIIGVDHAPARELLDDLATDKLARVRVYRSDQTEIPLPLRGWTADLIIDDAGHLSSKTIASFICWWPRLKPGGLYIVEDTATSYHPSYEGHADPRVRPRNFYGHTTMQWFQRLTDHVNAWAYPPQHTLGDFSVASVCFYPNLVVVRKKAS